jgi:hypothetical protein
MLPPTKVFRSPADVEKDQMRRLALFLLSERREHFDRVGQDFVVGVRAHTGEVSTVYLMDVDIEKLVKFLSQSSDLPAETRLLRRGDIANRGEP